MAQQVVVAAMVNFLTDSEFIHFASDSEGRVLAVGDSYRLADIDVDVRQVAVTDVVL